jgi:hypothetical protein
MKHKWRELFAELRPAGDSEAFGHAATKALISIEFSPALRGKKLEPAPEALFKAVFGK